MEAIAQARRLIEQRIQELDSERAGLVEALSSLTVFDHAGDKRANGHSARPRTPTAGRSSLPSNGKRAPRGQRQTQFLTQLTSNPGASMSEIARKMGVKPQQLYPIAHRLEQSGAIVKAATGYQPKQAATETSAPVGAEMPASTRG